MKAARIATSLAAGALMLAAVAAPAGAKPNDSCGQLVEQPGDQTFSYVDAHGNKESAALLIGLVNAAIQNVDADINALNNTELGANVQVVCITDSLNKNHLEILKDIDVDVIDAVDVVALNDVNVLAVDFDNDLVYVAPADVTIGS